MILTTALALLIILLVLALDFSLRRHPGRSIEVACSRVLLWLTIAALIASVVWQPHLLAGLAWALACSNAFVVHHRARMLAETASVRRQTRPDQPGESPYEQFINTFFSHFDSGDADTIEFEFRQWRMEVRFKKGERVSPVTDTPFHLILQIKRMFDAATVRNLKTGEHRLRYVARGILYEFSSEEIAGTLLRLRLIGKHSASTEESSAFDRLMASAR